MRVLDPVVSGQTQRPFPNQVRVINRGRREKDVRETRPTLLASEAGTMAKEGSNLQKLGWSLADRQNRHRSRVSPL